MAKILVSGADGFVGTRLCCELRKRGHSVRGALLRPAPLPEGCEAVVVGDIGRDADWSAALKGVDVVIHLAARVHMMHDRAADPLTEFRKVNTQGTLQLASEAARLGVKRLVYISTIKVNGEESARPYTADSMPNPTDPYGISKLEAEQGLRQIEAERGLEVVIVRPTLVYGPEVKANFLQLLKAVDRGVPLPFGCIDNRRSLIGLGNLVDAIITCATHHKAAGNTYLVSDGDDVSTPELVRRIAKALGRPARLLSVPVWLLRMAGTLTGRRAAVDRLAGSLAVDSGKIRRELGWTPPFTMEEELTKTAEWFLGKTGNLKPET